MRQDVECKSRIMKEGTTLRMLEARSMPIAFMRNFATYMVAKPEPQRAARKKPGFEQREVTYST